MTYEILANSRGGSLWIWNAQKMDWVSYEKDYDEYHKFFSKESVNHEFERAKEYADLLRDVRIAAYFYKEIE